MKRESNIPVMLKECPRDRTIGRTEIREPNLIAVTIREEELSLYQSAMTNSKTFSLIGTSNNLPSGIPVGEGHLSVVIENHSTKDKSFSRFWNALEELRDQSKS